MNAFDAIMEDGNRRIDEHLSGRAIPDGDRTMMMQVTVGCDQPRAEHPLLPTFEEIGAAARAGAELERNLGFMSMDENPSLFPHSGLDHRPFRNPFRNAG